MGTPPLDLKVQTMEYGFRVPLPCDIPNTKRYAYRLDQDPLGMMRVIEFDPERLVSVDDVVHSHVAGGFDVYIELLYEKRGRHWESYASNKLGVTGARLEPGERTYQALDELLLKSQAIRFPPPSSTRKIKFPPRSESKRVDKK